MTTNREPGSPVVGVPTDPSDHPEGSEASAASTAAGADQATGGAGPADPAGEPAATEAVAVELPLEDATAYGVEGYDPEDPWNAVLCVESERAVTVLPLTPKSLGELVTSLAEVQEAQRFALGADGLDAAGAARPSRRGGFRNVSDAARFATGSAPVARLWQGSMRGRLTIIAGAVFFVAIGIIASIFAR